MKHNFTLNVCLLITMLIVGLQAKATTDKEFEFGDFKYEVTAPGIVSVTGLSKNYSSNVVTVPANFKYEGVGYTVKSIGENAFRWTKVTSVTLPNTIDSLKYCAFYDASELSYIGMPATLKYMGDYCFGSTKIVSIVIPEGVSEIPGSCFFTTKTLRDITLPSTLKKICNSSFYKCESLSNIVIPEGTVEIGKAFLYCNALQTVQLPSTLKILGAGCFNNCTALREINIPSSVEEIGDEAFFQDAMISEVTLPRSLKTIGGGVFAKSGLRTIKLEEGNQNFKLVDGCIYDKDGKVLYLAPIKGITDLTVAEGCRGIGCGAFWGSEVTNVTLPESIRAFDNYAFCQSSLSRINFPFSLRFIGEQALASTNLSKVEFPENMPTISNAVLAGCKGLTEVVIPSAVEMVENRAFWGCSNLKTIRCLGSNPPELDEWYDTDECPFQNVYATLSVPKGLYQDYKDTSWGSTSNITKIVDEESPVLTPDTIIVEGEYNEGYKNITALRLRFSSAVTAKTASPRIVIRIEDDFSGAEEVTASSWNMKAEGNDIVITPLDGSNAPVTIALTRGLTYYAIIPSHIAGSAESLTEHLVVGIVTPEADPITPIAITPTNKSEMDQINCISLTFDREIYVTSYDAKAELRKADGSLVNVTLWYAQLSDSIPNTVNIYPCTVSGSTAYISPVTLESGIDYTLSLPEGVIRSKELNARNTAVTIEMSGKDLFPLINPVSISPAENQKVETISNITLTFDEEVSVVTQLPKVIMTKGTLNGEKVEVEHWLASVRSKAPKELIIRPVELEDGQSYDAPITLEEGVTYYIQLPKAICEGKDSYGRNAAKVIVINPSAAGIGNVTSDASHIKVMKLIENGRLVIRKDGKDYDASGKNIK